MNTFLTLFLCWVPCHLGFSTVMQVLSLLQDTCSHSHLQLEPLSLVLVALKVSSPILPARGEWGPLPAAGSREGAGCPLVSQGTQQRCRNQFLIDCWETCFVKHPEQGVGGIIWKRTDLEQLVSLTAA